MLTECSERYVINRYIGTLINVYTAEYSGWHYDVPWGCSTHSMIYMWCTKCVCAYVCARWTSTSGSWMRSCPGLSRSYSWRTLWPGELLSPLSLTCRRR